MVLWGPAPPCPCGKRTGHYTTGRCYPDPPDKLRYKPLPEWTPAQRTRHEPPGYVWSVDRLEWVTG